MIRITIETDETARGGLPMQSPAAGVTTGFAAPISAGEPPSYLHQLVASQRGEASVLAVTPGMTQPQAEAPQGAIDAGAAPAWLREAVKEAAVRAAEDILRRGEGI